MVPAGVDPPPPDPNPKLAAEADVRYPDWLIWSDEEMNPDDVTI